MTRLIEGGCLCGAVRYRVDDSLGLKAYACHCTDCQTRSGSAFGIQQGVREDEMRVTGETITGHHVQPSGATATIIACATCLTRLWTANDRRPGIVNLRAGTMDDSKTIVPGFHLYSVSAQPWIVLPDDVPVLPGMPDDLAHWMRLLSPDAA